MNKYIAPVLCSFALSFSFQAHAEQSWLDSIKSMLGLGDKAQTEQSQQAKPSINGLLDSLKSLNVSDKQAEGGLASLMNYVKNNVSSGDFQKLSQSLPGVSQLLNSVPKVKEGQTEQGLSGLLDKASEYSDSLKSINEVKKQFESLGLSPDMITQYGGKIKQYLDSPQGQEAKGIIMSSLNKLL